MIRKLIVCFLLIGSGIVDCGGSASTPDDGGTAVPDGSVGGSGGIGGRTGGTGGGLGGEGGKRY